MHLTATAQAGASTDDQAARRMAATAELASQVNSGMSFDDAGAAAVRLLHDELAYEVVMLCAMDGAVLRVVHEVGAPVVPAQLRPPRDLGLWASLPNHAHAVVEDFTADPWPDLTAVYGAAVWTGMTHLLTAEDAAVGLLGAYSSQSPPASEDLVWACVIARLVETAYWRQMHRQRHARAQRLESVTRMAAGVCHDFASLLTAATIEAGLLSEATPPASEEMRSHAEALQLTITKAVSLIEQLQAFTGFRARAALPLDPVVAVESLRPLLHSIAGDRIQLDIEADPNRSIVCIDPVALERIVVNLVRNGVEAIMGTGHISISVSSIQLWGPAAQRVGLTPGRYVRLVVTDDGCGMDDATLAAAIEPYFTTKQMTAEVGRGLGLSVVHGIIADEGGVLHLDSAAGRGTAAAVYLPTAVLTS